MTEVRCLGLWHRVVIDVDHVIEHADRRAHGASQLVEIQLAVLNVLRQVDRAQITDRDLFRVGVQRDLGAEIGGVHHATVLLGRAQVAGIFEGHPGVAGFKDHAQHLAPQVLCLQRFMKLELTISRHLLVLLVALLERGAIEIMQIRHVVG